MWRVWLYFVKCREKRWETCVPHGGGSAHLPGVPVRAVHRALLLRHYTDGGRCVCALGLLEAGLLYVLRVVVGQTDGL